MKKNFSTTLILAVVFVALVAWYQLYEKKWRPERNKEEEKSKQLITLTQDEIQELTIEKMKNPPADDAVVAADAPAPEYEIIRLKKVGQEWNVVEPVQDLADSSTVSSMVSTLATAKQDRIIEENPKDLSMFGLKHPLYKITARKDSADQGQTVFVGRNTPVNYNAYAQVGGKSQVYRVSRSLRSTFEKPLKDVRNKTILAGFTRSDITEVEIQGPKQNVIVKRESPDKDEWVLARDLLPADNTEWIKVLNAVVELKASGFAAEDTKQLAEYGLSQPAFRVWLHHKKDGGKLGLILGKSKDKVYAKRDDKSMIYEVDKDIVTKLETPADKYRSTRLANFNRFDVKRIKLERRSETVELLKEDAGWTFPTSPSDKVDGSKVDQLLSALQDTKIDKYLVGQKGLAADTDFTVRLFEKKEADEVEKLTLKFARPRGPVVRAERSGLAIPFQIKSEDFKKLSLEKKDFIQAQEKKTEEKKEEKKS